MKRAMDIAVSLIGLVALAPLLAAIALTVWIGDRHAPFFRGVRVARGGSVFHMLKFRSMRPDAWKTGVNSTAAEDPRVTGLGRVLRRCKLDELLQLWNVLTGDMSLVGPRPQAERDAALYTEEERRMLTVRPGITDLASIVFADEGEILAGSSDPDLRYNQVIRPWKSRLALLYVNHASLTADVRIVLLTALALVSRRRALGGVEGLLRSWAADPKLCAVAGRRRPLEPFPPPGASRIVERYREPARAAASPPATSSDRCTA
ncbi:MAG TPA: sugar transferase [Bryobacteraceae bacterium]|nr:sugar transferase [Bryobacteraceae bacterium]